ncbi:hypothetical protein [Sphingobacterium sp. UBA6645]|uniref:hypothetical protein n=1 Tax=Sphingobacterium sp. UBA6645 TaxID=1947511 RepID=UPI0025E913E5|nr:hypothetical protein [Sphingobacterium sp. UBA6645]
MMPFDPNELFKYELDPEKVQLANLILTMQNNVMLKILIQKATENDWASDHLAEYESKLAEVWAKLYSQLDIGDKDKDLDIEL